MVSEKVLKRVKDCQDMVDSGRPLRNALLEAHTDIDTYKKYRGLINPQKDLKSDIKDINGLESTNNLFNVVGNSNGKVKKPTGRPRKYDMKKIPQKITLEKKYVDKLKKEAEESGHPLAIVEADYIIDGLKKKYKDL